MKLFIGCSSSMKIKDEYMVDCKKYLDELFKEDNDLVFGACNQSLMGLSYESALKNKRNVIGIVPEIYKDQLNNFSGEYILTKTISNRTDSLIKESDALIFLPGGIGTVYELFTAIESKRSGEVDKPIIIYNSCGYFDKLFSFLDEIYKEKFADEIVKTNYYISNSANDTIKYLKEYYNVKSPIKK